MNDEKLELLSAWFDGELSPEEAAHVEAILERDPESQKMLQKFTQLSKTISCLSIESLPCTNYSNHNAMAAEVLARAESQLNTAENSDNKFEGKNDFPDHYTGNLSVPQDYLESQDPSSEYSLTHYYTQGWTTQRIGRMLAWPMVVLLAAIMITSMDWTSREPDAHIVIDNSNYNRNQQSTPSENTPALATVQGDNMFEQPGALIQQTETEVAHDSDQQSLFVDTANPAAVKVSTNNTAAYETIQTQDTNKGTQPVLINTQEGGSLNMNLNSTSAKPGIIDSSDVTDKRMVYQCIYNPQTFKATDWIGFLTELGIAINSGDNPLAIATWVWTASPDKRTTFVQRARLLAGIVDVQSMYVPIDLSKPGVIADSTEPANQTEIRLVPMEIIDPTLELGK